MQDPYKTMLDEALEACEKAFYECVPTPVRWQQADLMDNPIGEPSEIDGEGVCGGAIITGLSGRSEPFVKWCHIHMPNFLRKGTYKGYDLFIPWSKFKKPYRDQSAERYEAGARAYAEVLKSHGVKCGVHAYLT